MISPRAIATLGLGFIPALLARLGFWQAEQPAQQPQIQHRISIVSARSILIAVPEIETIGAIASRDFFASRAAIDQQASRARKVSGQPHARAIVGVAARKLIAEATARGAGKSRTRKQIDGSGGRDASGLNPKRTTSKERTLD